MPGLREEAGMIQSLKKKESVNHSVMSDPLQPHVLWPARLLCPWILQVRILE